LRRDAAANDGAEHAGAPQQRLVEDAAREAARAERQRDLGALPAAMDAQVLDRDRSHRVHIDAELAEIGYRLDAEELAADPVVRGFRALDNDGRLAAPGEVAGSGGARDPAANDRDPHLKRSMP